MATYTGTLQFYDTFAKKLMDGTIDLDTHTLKAALVTSSYTFSAAHSNTAQITNEVSGSGYDRQTLGSPAFSATTSAWGFDSDDLAFSASGGVITARRYIVIDEDAAGDALCWTGLLNNADADVTTSDGNVLTIQVSANGWFKLAY